MLRKSDESRHYIDNKKLLAELKRYHKAVKVDPNFRIPEYVGECILLICKHLSTRWNFRDYTWVEEMVSDATEDCVSAVKNFDPDRGNPLGYFTQIAWYAFLQRISQEKKQQYIKHKNFQNQHMLDDVEIDSALSNQVIEDFERDLKEKTKSKKSVALTKSKTSGSIDTLLFKKKKKVK